MNDSTEKNNGTEQILSRQNSEVEEGFSGTSTHSTLKKQSIRGGVAAVLGRGATIVLQIGTTLVLARLLSPADYGLQAMVLTLVNLCSLFQDAGLNSAAIQRESLTSDLLSTLFWINLALGTVLTIAVAATSPFLVAFYKEPRLLWLTVASASVFLFNSLAVQHRALLNRAMRFTTTTKIDILSSTTGTIVAIGMAALKCGYWSLIGQNITIPIVAAVAFWIAMPWRPGKPKWRPELRSMLRFGGIVSLNNFVVYVGYNAEKILLGRFWGPAALGLYGRAYQLSTLPVQQVTDSLGSVAFPMLSRLQGDPQRQSRSYLKSHSLIASVTVPAVICCALFANEIVRVMLGPKWSEAAPILRLLSPMVLVFALMNPLSWLLMATGRVERSLKIGIFIAPVVILSVLAGIRHGPSGVALGYSTAMVLLFVPLVAWAKSGTGITARDYLDCIKRPLIAGALGGITAWLFKIAFVNILPMIPLMIVGLIIFVTIYAFLLIFVMGQRDLYVDLMSYLFQRANPLTAKG
jgi:O-antigen/teichoic acid export membrane protein